ncbi:sterol desaturase family protein, partial [Aliarcobacter butzleri]
KQIVLMYTISIFVVSDFTRYWLHRFLHTIPFLWEFHKIHHSATVFALTIKGTNKSIFIKYDKKK